MDPTLNHDIEDEPESVDYSCAEWTPMKGLIRGTCWTAAMAAIFACIVCVLAFYASPVVLNLWLSIAIGFIITWALFAMMHRMAGQVGWVVTTIVVILAVLTVISKQGVFATAGLQTTSGDAQSGAIFFHPLVIMMQNYGGFIGIGAAALMCRSGDSILNDVLSVIGR